MKKVTLFIASVILAGAAFAQVEFVPGIKHVNQLQKAMNGKKIAGKARTSNVQMATASADTVVYWLSYADAANAQSGNISYVNWLPLNFDSLPLLKNYYTTTVHIQFESAAQILDVKSSDFVLNATNIAGGVYQLNSKSAYTVDSMGVGLNYLRSTAPTVVDTMIVTLYSSATAGNLVGPYYFTGQTANYASDTVFFDAQQYSHGTNAPIAKNAVTFKIPLTVADSTTNPTTGFPVKYFNTNRFSVAAGKLLATAVTFKSGGPAYSDTTTFGWHNMNTMGIITNEVNGDAAGKGTYGTYTYCNGKASHPCDWNVSSVIPTSTRYNLDPGGNAGGWDSLYTPSWAWNLGYSYQAHEFYYKLTQTSSFTGINEITPANLNVSQNVPNPFSDVTVINYSLAENVGVSLEVFDITGQKVQTIEQGKQAIGVHTIQLNSGTLQAGMYFYTLTAGTSRITKRMIIVK